MKIKRLDWDSSFFGCEIGELTAFEEGKTDPGNNFDLITVKQHVRFNVDISGYKLAYAETKVIFEKKLSSTEENYDSDIKDTDLEYRDPDFFQRLAYESGKHSRFLQDGNFGEEKFHRLYDQWIINSLNKKFALKTFYFEETGKAIAFITLQNEGNTGKIGLIATDPLYQGKGYGRRLLRFTERYCHENQMYTLEIPTQKENTTACRFYEKMGYSIKEELIIKHYWK